jgi:hypothetical protein
MARAKEGKTSIASEIKSIKLWETQRRDARIIKAAHAEQQRMGLSMIKIQQGRVDRNYRKKGNGKCIISGTTPEI